MSGNRNWCSPCISPFTVCLINCRGQTDEPIRVNEVHWLDVKSAEWKSTVRVHFNDGVNIQKSTPVTVTLIFIELRAKFVFCTLLLLIVRNVCQRLLISPLCKDNKGMDTTDCTDIILYVSRWNVSPVFNILLNY